METISTMRFALVALEVCYNNLEYPVDSETIQLLNKAITDMKATIGQLEEQPSESAQPSVVQKNDDLEKTMTYTHATTAAVVALNSLLSIANSGKEANLSAICERAEFAKRVLLEQGGREN